MTSKHVVPTLAATVACALGVVPVASASSDVQTASSANWAGYVVGGSSSSTQFKSVSGSWVAPTAKCTSGQGYSSFWVGLGGSSGGSSSASDAGSWADPSSGMGSDSSSSTSLEQAGTEADCNASGSPTYSAWYELVPSGPVTVDMAVHPGDHITSKVTVDGGNVTIQLNNSTTGGSFEKTLQVSSADVSSAEWIAEAPSTCSQGVSDCTPLPLTDFGTAQFSSASATTTDGHTGSISDSAWQTAAVQLSPSASEQGFGAQFTSYGSDSAGATPSSLSSDGSSFSVAYSADASSGSSSGSTGSAGSAGSTGSAGSGGYGDPTGGSGGYGDPTGGYGGDGGYGGYGGYGDPTAGYGGGYGGYGDAGGWGGYGYIIVPGA
jgi:hypothetical protein